MRPIRRLGGHLALQYLAKWGCGVTAISSSRERKGEACGFGAGRPFGQADFRQRIQPAARREGHRGRHTGPLIETAQMLAFTARHGIKPMIETFPMVEADRAIDHSRRGKSRYRAVLVA
jgi:alcohol/geraniol dehydrogenase (NADP+)